MAYNFLELVNDVARRLNEVPLSTTNFASAVGFHSDIKSYVNSAIHSINFQDFEWPFNHHVVDLTLVPNQVKYPYPADTKTIAFDTFILKGDSGLGSESGKLKVLDYEEHLDKTIDQEINPADYAAIPRNVFRSRDLTFGILPPPSEAYGVRYEYYNLPIDLVNWDDVPSIPESFRWVILAGAMHHAYMFRGDTEQASVSLGLFDKGIKDMRKIYINRYEYVRSSMIG